MPSFSFVYAADLHLDSPFIGIDKLPDVQSRIALRHPRLATQETPRWQSTTRPAVPKKADPSVKSYGVNQFVLFQNIGNHFTRDVGQAEIPAVEAIGEFCMLEAE